MMRRFVGILVVALLAGASTALAQQSSSPSESTAGARPAGPVVNLNTATAEQLASLPGIGAKTAQRILEHREKHGAFKKVEDLMNVKGIGEKSFLKLKPRLTVTAPKS